METRAPTAKETGTLSAASAAAQRDKNPRGIPAMRLRDIINHPSHGRKTAGRLFVAYGYLCLTLIRRNPKELAAPLVKMIKRDNLSE